ncbi:MAG: carbohydrate ABC transporter permease [Clostridia bacterium]|nr:carbohydrate ABC transporter permease [Clostridia bacterium]
MNKEKSLKKSRSRVGTNIFLMIVAILVLVPLWYLLNNAFKTPQAMMLEPLIIRPQTFTFANIARAFKIMNYPKLLLNNVIILVISCSFLVVLGSFAGYAINISNNKAIKNLYIFIVLIMTLPFQLAMIPLVSMLKSMNLMDSFFGTSLVFTAWSLPFVIFLYTGYMKTIPKELLEASIVDGCGLFKTYVYIYMPLLKTITGTVLILRGVHIWNDLLIPLVTITKSSMSTLSLKLYSFASTRITAWDLVFGGTLLVVIPIMVLFLSLQKVFIQGIVAGAVKG